MSKKFKILSALTTSSLVAGSLLPMTIFAVTPDMSSNINSAVDYLKSQQETSGKISGFGTETSWAIMGFAAAGIDPETIETNGNSLVDYIRANPPASSTPTAWERDILAITAAGENPYNFGGTNYIKTLESFAAGGQLGGNTLLNDDTFGVLALISAGPSADQQIISDSVNFIIANQNADGGLSWSTSGDSDTNDTAIAIMALNAAKSAGFTNVGLGTSLDEAKNYMLTSQNPDGGWSFTPGDTSDASSTAWGIQAMLGDDMVVSNALNFLVSLQNLDGSVSWMSGFGGDTFTSAYALSAFAQRAFPVGAFTQEFPGDPGQVPGNQDPQDGEEENPRDSDDDGDVLSATDTNDDGKVLAATLPDTGIAYEPKSMVRALDQPFGSQKDSRLRFFGLFLALGSSSALAGVSLRCVYKKLVEYDIN
ncbi:MAG: prenyltransferase/squalene oxidase repeat-containing protein [Candidatus Woykebacteria bacterium]